VGDCPEQNTDILSELKTAYADRPVVPSPAGPEKENRLLRAQKEAEGIDKIVGLRNQRVLEVGCGEGELSYELAKNYNAIVTGIDVRDLQGWKTLDHPNLRLLKHDLTRDPSIWYPNAFTRIISRAVWEHIRHPYAALKRCQELLEPDGKMYLYANQYRSAIASHLYRQIPFPWPHLLFSPETIASWLGVKQVGWAFWVNKLTYSHYLLYFKKLGFHITYERLSKRPIDREFYRKFEEKLGLYPDFDLELDFFEVVLEFDPAHPKEPIPDPVYRLG
jgi:SAM-dependent methyltransferase